MTPALGYSEMKDSGAVWLGKIPSDWAISKIGSLYTQRNEKVSDKDYPPLSVTMKGILPQLDTAAKTEDGDNRKLVKIGDFAINSRSDRRGSCGISPYDGSVSLINTILTPRNAMHPGYYNWLFHTSLFADEFYKWGHGIVDDLWTTRWQEMKKIIVPVPSYNIQEQISAYLDTQCAEIDEIIAEAKASIEDYKQWKASIIYEAVTKGLNPDAEMKESGIPWIGSMPAHIKISRVGLHYNIILGKMLCTEQITSDYSLEPYYCAANVHFDGIDSNELKQMWFSPDEKKKYLVKKGDLLVVEGGAGAGGCAVSTQDSDGVFIQNSIMIVRPKKNADNRYLKYLLESFVYMKYVDFVCNKATIPHFTKEKLSGVPFIVFTPDEQEKIADYLDERCNKIDALINEKKSFIEELESYKKSLIYEVTTGKRQVC